MAKLVQTDAFVVIPVHRQAEQIFLAETGWEPTGAADPFVLVGGIWMMAVLGHIRIKLVLADNDEVHAVACHFVNYVGATGEQVSDEIVSSLQGLVGYLGGGGNRDSPGIEILSIELSGGLAVALTNSREEGFWRSGNRRRGRV